ELLGAIPESEAEHEPATRERVEDRALLGDVHRVMERKHKDCRADCKRPEMRGQRSDREQRRRPVGTGVVVLLDPDRVEAGPVGQAHVLDRLGEMSRAVRRDDADPERHQRSTTQSSAACGRVSSSYPSAVTRNVSSITRTPWSSESVTHGSMLTTMFSCSGSSLIGESIGGPCTSRPIPCAHLSEWGGRPPSAKTPLHAV